MRQSIKVNTALFEASSYIKIDYVLITEEKKKAVPKYSKQENANYDGKVHANQVSSLLVKSAAILFLDVINVGINDIPCPKRIRRSS